MRIVQIAPEIRPGSGVEAVAFHLEEAWTRAGISCERFTLDDSGSRLHVPARGMAGKLTLLVRVVWFTTVGTVVARRRFRRAGADTVVICHNDVLFGDVYVNHGVLAEAMRARGHAAGRMVRNPLHLFTWLRDAVRFAGRTHRVVVNLTGPEERALRCTYPRIRPRMVVIGNGVDVERYRPDPAERARMRWELDLRDGDVVALFIGHEFERKGLPLVLEALRGTRFRLLVVGGTEDACAAGARDADRLGIGDRVRFVGAQADPRPWIHASDVLVSPSAYESYGLVVLEAMACGLPVVATPVGCVPDVVVDGGNGAVVSGTAVSVRSGLERVAAADRAAWAAAARRTAEEHSWPGVAERYLALFREVLAERSR